MLEKCWRNKGTSTSADTVYACFGGKLLPGKHLSLDLAIKSLTGSKQLVTLTNRFGHTAGNETIRRLDMELEHTCKRSSDLVPNGIVKQRDLSIGLAWNNFDLNIETLSGAGTVHHTYDICYQNIDENCMEVIEEITPGTSSEGKRKRKFSKVQSTYNEELPPYFHHHQVVLMAQIFQTRSLQSARSSIARGRSSD